MTLENVLNEIKPTNKKMLRAAKAKQDQLTKPLGSLTLIEDISVKLAAIQNSLKPKIKGKAVAVFAADHGVTEANISAYPKAVTQQMVLNFLTGGAAINALCSAQNTKLLVIDVGVDADFPEHKNLINAKVRKGSRNMLTEAAMTYEELNAALEVGYSAAEQLKNEGANLVAAGEMGIGNTSSATALIATLTSTSVKDLTGRGTGLDDEGLKRKIDTINKVLSLHTCSKSEPFELLRCVGGLELAAMTGFYLRSASLKQAIVLDGFVSHSAALIAVALKPELKDYLFASHKSTTKNHRLRYSLLGIKPLLNFSLRLGEGTGAVLAMPLIESAAAILSRMAGFTEAAVSMRIR